MLFKAWLIRVNAYARERVGFGLDDLKEDVHCDLRAMYDQGLHYDMAGANFMGEIDKGEKELMYGKCFGDEE